MRSLGMVSQRIKISRFCGWYIDADSTRHISKNKTAVVDLSVIL